MLGTWWRVWDRGTSKQWSNNWQAGKHTDGAAKQVSKQQEQSKARQRKARRGRGAPARANRARDQTVRALRYTTACCSALAGG